MHFASFYLISSKGLPEEVRSGILGNVGGIICFRLGTANAKVMAEEFYPTFKVEGFIGVSRFSIFLRLLIKCISGNRFIATIVK